VNTVCRLNRNSYQIVETINKGKRKNITLKKNNQEVYFNGFKITSVHIVHASARTYARTHKIALLSVRGVTRNFYYNILKFLGWSCSVFDVRFFRSIVVGQLIRTSVHLCECIFFQFAKSQWYVILFLWVQLWLCILYMPIAWGNRIQRCSSVFSSLL
jgi:hypothetical protein